MRKTIKIDELKNCIFTYLSLVEDEISKHKTITDADVEFMNIATNMMVQFYSIVEGYLNDKKVDKSK